jgi:hypothetical protein
MSSPAADTSQPTMSLPPSPHAHHSDSTLPSSHSRVGGWHDEDLIDHHLEFHDVLRNQQPKQAVIHNQESVESVAFDRRIPFPGLGTSHDGDMDDSTTGGQSSLTQLNATKPPLPFPNPTPPALTSTSTSSSHPSTPTHSHSLPINMDQPPTSVDTVDIETQPDELMCRICFGSSSPEEVEELGRLISPCLCSGSMSVSVCERTNERTKISVVLSCLARVSGEPQRAILSFFFANRVSSHCFTEQKGCSFPPTYSAIRSSWNNHYCLPRT